MKKGIIWFMVIFCICSVVLCSCGTKMKPLEGELEQQIKQDYVTKMAEANINVSYDDVRIDKYLGTYGEGAVALFITSTQESYLSVIVDEEIAGVSFSFPSTQSLYIYHDSEFILLKEAFERGLISKSDVWQIHHLYTTEGAMNTGDGSLIDEIS